MNWILNLRTEFSFKEVYGPIDRTVQLLAAQGHTAVGIADLNNTFAHVPWAKACKKHKIKPVFGVVLNSVQYPTVKEKQLVSRVTLIAMNNAGLRELYELMAVAYHTDNFYYFPRIGHNDIGSLSNNITVLTQRGDGSLPKALMLLSPSTDKRYLPTQLPTVAGISNCYPTADDLEVYQLFAGSAASTATYPQHIISADEWSSLWPNEAQALQRSGQLLGEATATLNHASMVRYRGHVGSSISPAGKPGRSKGSRPAGKPSRAQAKVAGQQPTAIEELATLAKAGAARRGYSLKVPERAARLAREMELIEQKDYADYFLIVADMIAYAKQHMLVGPSRGSSAGSLVCYLIGITEIDPLEYGLLFERFIDINREDLPDIDCDFPDDKRHMVIEYLEQKYGKDNVAHIGTVSRLMPKSAIQTFAQALGIPAYETTAVKDSIIERSSGDARSAQCIEDTFKSTDVGKAFIEKYPAMALVANVEGHANHSGVHAAGIIITNDAITNYSGINTRDSVMMMDKKDAEYLGLLKIDVLGLRTLSVLADICDRIGMTYEQLYRLPLNDQATFDIFNNMRLWGIFQFEGYALQSLTRQMGVHRFDDITVITALARPGPLHNGGATDFIARRIGREETTYTHEAIKPMTEDTYGTVVYQEQVMQIVRIVGSLSWEDTSQLRKAMSKSMGEEFFNLYWEKFKKGTDEKGISEKDARAIWESVMTFGSWAFNKSHAVSYALVSYWTAYFKAHHPLEFAVATLNNLRTPEQGLKILRDMYTNSGIKYTAVSADSTDQWRIVDGQLVGPITLIKGVGPKKAEDIIARRKAGQPLLPGQQRLLENAKTIYDDLYPAETMWGTYYTHPERHNIATQRVSYIKDVAENGTYIFLGCLKDRNQRDLNEYGNVVKRGGKLIQGNSLFLNLTLEDDTDSIICTVDRFLFPEMGKPIAEAGKVDEDWFLVKGYIKNNWRKIYVERIVCLTNPTLISSVARRSGKSSSRPAFQRRTSQ